MSKPAWAASIWAAGDKIYLELPGPRPHTIEIPNNSNGIEYALKIIHHRDSNSKLTSQGSPTQHQVNRALKYEASKIVKLNPKNRLNLTPQQSIAARAALRAIGLL